MGMFLLLAVLSLIIPTVSQLWGHSSVKAIQSQSRGTAVVIMVSYVLWLVFQLRTHQHIFNELGEKQPKEKSFWTPKATEKAGAAEKSAAIDESSDSPADEEEESEDPQLSFLLAATATVVSTVLLAFNTQYATDSIQGMMEKHQISQSFMGIVVLPLLSISQEAIACGVRDKMDMSLSLTLGRSVQTALMVVPLVILIAWGMHVDDMTLDFDGFAVASLFASVIIVTYVLQEGRSNW